MLPNCVVLSDIKCVGCERENGGTVVLYKVVMVTVDLEWISFRGNTGRGKGAGGRGRKMDKPV